MNDLFLTGIASQVERQLENGRKFILEAPTTVPAIWGHGSDVLWSEGEPLFIVGPQGVGKSTVAQQLALGRGGVLEPELLGFPITPDPDRIVLYLACDRPAQIARSLRRMVNNEHADALATRIKVWRGPLPFDLVQEPQRLALLAEALGAGTIIVDSLKDVAYPLSNDDVGSAVNRAFGTVVAAGIELAVVHHGRKATSDNKKPNTLADVYGSTWLTAGAGSVVSLWGEAGAPLVELTHLKQPADDVGPLEIEHDHDNGVTRLRDRTDAWSVLQDAGNEGVSAPDAATLIYGRKATRPQVEKVRRKLQRLADQGLAIPGKGVLKTDPVVFRPMPSNGTVEHRVAPRVAHTPATRGYTNPGNTVHDSYTAPIDHPVSPLRGTRGQQRVAAVEGWTDDELQNLIDTQEQVDPGGNR